MSTAVFSPYSSGNSSVAKRTRDSIVGYGAIRGYDVLRPMRSIDGYLARDLKMVRALLDCYDTVLMVDADALITNTDFDLSIIEPPNVAMSREIEGRAPINAGVSLWSSNDLTRRIITAICDKEEVWSNKGTPDIYWQSYLPERPDLMEHVTILNPRILNATDQTGDWHWRPGDFLCHFLGGTVESKVERIEGFLKNAV